MSIDLLSIIEKNKKIEKEQTEIDFKKELNKLIGCIVINSDDEFKTNMEELPKRLDLKYTTDKNQGRYLCFTYNPYNYGKYIIKLTKDNIKRIQDYLNEEVEDND